MKTLLSTIALNPPRLCEGTKMVHSGISMAIFSDIGRFCSGQSYFFRVQW